MSDSETFNDLAKAVFDMTDEVSPRHNLEDLKAMLREVEPGRLTQYSINGPGYSCCPNTVPRLPAGVYSIEYVNERVTFAPARFITDDLLRLPDSKSDFVISEITRFWGLKEKYAEYGYSHKRGVLLFGPAGSGKTSTIAFVAQQMVKDDGLVILVNQTSPSFITNGLHQLREVEPDRKIVVILEDLDTIIKEHGETNVLSLLDGEQSIANVVFVATTNYPENLDGRVINRPSRFDRVVHIDVPSAEARRLYLESRNLGLDPEELNAWVESTDNFSIAHLKELIIGVTVLGGNFDEELERLHSMFKGQKCSDGMAEPKKMGFGF